MVPIEKKPAKKRSQIKIEKRKLEPYTHQSHMTGYEYHIQSFPLEV